MARTSVSTTNSSSSSRSETNASSKSQSTSQSQSTTQKVLDEALRDKILAGLMGYMTDEEIAAYAENLMKPQLNAGLEAAQQAYDTTKLSKEQEIQLLADTLSRSIEEQENAYRKSIANVETAALARGMGRSSYTLQALAGQGNALAEAVNRLTTDTQKQQGMIQQQISLASQQKAQTTGRLSTDYAASLAAKVQELRQQQRQEYNQNYLTAISGSMGSMTTGSQQTQGTSEEHSVTDTKGSSTSTTVTKSLGGSGPKKNPIGGVV